jgi:3-deoxy-D-manno-octulosonic-acid transferase
MILLLYNLVSLIVLVVGAPWWLWKMATTHKYRDGLSERLGSVARIRRRLGNPPARPVLWLHAVSVGEVLAISRLADELERAFPDCELLISTTTRTGQDLARQRFDADRVFYCPLDLFWAVGAWLNALHPRVLILAETEFWPNLLSSCFRRRIPVVVVNARISDRSWPRYLKFRLLWRPILKPIARIMAQSPVDAERLRAIGCNPASVTVAGNLKFDVRAVHEADATRRIKSLSGKSRIVVAGSTLQGEEAALLEAWPQLLAADPNLVLVLAPRHPERFAAVAALLDQSGIPWVRRSSWPEQPKAPAAPLRPGQIVLLDTIGELASIYSLASVAFVGGSIVEAGGHNPLEPAQFAVPVVMGPSYVNFRAITDDLLAHQALRIATREELAAALIELLKNRDAAQAMGQRARQVFDAQAGATNRCVEAIRQLIIAQEHAQ